jgi:ATP-grasp domain
VPPPRRVLVVAPSAWDREVLAAPGLRADHEFLWAGEELTETPSPWDALRFDVHRWLDDAAARFRGARLSGVVGTGEYPACFLAAALAERLRLPTPATRDVVLMGHKLHSRRLQAAAVPEATPAFEALDPRRPRLGALAFPVFVKPVKGTMSIRAQLARDDAELRAAVRFGAVERLRFRAMLRPYQQLLDRCSDGAVPAHWFVAEAPLTGDQVTVDGFVQGRRVTVQGVVDSVMFPGTRSFRRFDYPSRLPPAVQARMVSLVTRLVAASGLDDACFNVELFHDPGTGSVHVIEINPRMSYQFGDLYEMVDGTSTYAVQLRLATGRPVEWRAGGGRYAAATSFVLRVFHDALVRRVPGEGDLAVLRDRFPGATVKVLCGVGERLSHQDQDMGSFRYGIVNLGGSDAADLEGRWDESQKYLRFDLIK